MFKLIIAFALVVAVNCDGYETVVPVSREQPNAQVVNVDEHISYPKYTFTYGVHDSISGDSKNQIETRDGDVVQGEYSLIDADGFKRIVKYTADDANGFKAVVDRQPITSEVTAPIAVKAPVVIKKSEVAKNIVPLSYTAPTAVKTVPVNYVVSPVIRSVGAPGHLAYSSGQVIYRSVPLAYNVAHLVGGPQIVYSRPVAYTKQVYRTAAPSLAIDGGW